MQESKVEPEKQDEFTSFWAIYPRRIEKKNARIAFSKLSPAEQQLALQAIPHHVKMWQAENRDIKYVPHAATWINAERWDDEIEIPDDGKPKCRECGSPYFSTLIMGVCNQCRNRS